MRREDILLRDAARRGEPRACVEMAARLFDGAAGFARNFKLGLAYVQQELDRESAAAIDLVAAKVPLEILMAQRAQGVLAVAAREGSRAGMLKLGIWHSIAGDRNHEGRALIRRSGLATGDWEALDPRSASELARLLDRHMPRDMLDAAEVLAAGARDALAEPDLQIACRCLHAASLLANSGAPEKRLAQLVSSAVQLAANSAGALDLPVQLVEASLRHRGEHGEVEAQYGLGCAYGGMAYGSLAPKQLVARTQLRRAAALLLRAADAGKSQAWLNLFEIASDCRSVAGNQEAARFFLEKAAGSGVVPAQRKLGALLLKEATSLERAELGVHWLSKAADGGDGAAHELLKTLVLPLPALASAIEDSIVAKVRAVDAELAARLTLARAFHLTRREALNFNARRDVRAWGLLIPGTSKENPKGRLAPAVHEPMRAELQRVSSLFGGGSALEAAFALQKARMQRRVFEALSISENMFFAAEIGRSWSHYGFGRHWAARAAPLLDELLGLCARWR
jgi:TPR repeat protein